MSLAEGHCLAPRVESCSKYEAAITCKLETFCAQSWKTNYKNACYLSRVKILIDSLSMNAYRKHLSMGLALIHLDTKHGDGQKFGDVNGIQGKD